ncbi:hypothetical protein BH24ACT14_BH24ACT14_10910 [soil metagenome]
MLHAEPFFKEFTVRDITETSKSREVGYLGSGNP